MKDNFVLSCCSTADLTKEHFEERNISYICFKFSLDGVQYLDDLGASVPISDFYQAMKDGAMTATSQVNVGEYEEYFESFLKEGKDVLHICLSSGISGTYNSAQVARDMLAERYPDREIYVVDSLAASSGYGLLMDKLADLRDEGMSVREAYEWTEANKLRVHHWVLTTDLTYFIRGGRISKAAGIVGGILNICPVIHVDPEGKLLPGQKVRGKKKGIEELASKMETYADNGLDYNGKCYISQSACYEDARAVADLVEARFPHLNGKVEINHIGTTIGSHTGPGTIALFFWGSERNA